MLELCQQEVVITCHNSIALDSVGNHSDANCKRGKITGAPVQDVLAKAGLFHHMCYWKGILSVLLWTACVFLTEF